MRIAVGLEYDGRAYCGWQSQTSQCSIQDKVEAALSKLAQDKVSVIAAGRTDTGVHASGQIIHFDINVDRPIQSWVRGVNTFLPSDIRVLWAQEVDDRFHARFSAISRSYRYILYNHPIRPALASGRVGWFYKPLNTDMINIAMQSLIGEHDFSSFRAAECQAKSPVKIMHEAVFFHHDEYLFFDFTANAFLHHMIRNIVGALVYIGSERQPVSWLEELIKLRDRTKAAPTFSPDGLYLTNVGYDACFNLPAIKKMPVIL
jgi:tRNA pseudouridine38-40 synthase